MILPVFEKSLEEFIIDRNREGENLKKDVDGLLKDGRNSRENLGYLTVEEYYNFFYDLNFDEYAQLQNQNLSRYSVDEYKKYMDIKQGIR